MDHVIYAENKKGHVISFSSKKAVVALFSQLTGLNEPEVKGYFKKSLSGRVNGKASVIVNPVKDFAFLFKIKPSQCYITFHYGVWNKAGFPLHN